VIANPPLTRCRASPEQCAGITGWRRLIERATGPETSNGWRTKTRAYPFPQWQGEPFEGRTLLVHPEQGFGDAIIACRFLPQVKARGGTVVLECKPELRRLLSELEGVDRIVPPGKPPEGVDLHCPVMSLAGLFDTTMDTLPPTPNLHIPEEARNRFRPVFARHADRFKVGIIWSGSVTFKGNRDRATGLDRFLPLAEVPGVQLYSLQKGPPEVELRESGLAGTLVIDIGGRVGDFADTAAAVEQLDVVVMTDSATAHLAGSLGRPVWNLLNFVPYWMYGLEGENTPWYPSMRLFRQRWSGDWDGVFDRARAALADAVAAKREGRWPT